MSEELYKKIILKRSRSTQHRGKPEQCHGEHEVKNPLCGDEITVYIQRLAENRIKLSFDGYGCAICLSSADLMAEALEGTPADEAPMMVSSFLELLANGSELHSNFAGLGDDFKAVAKVREFPSRIRCASLPWEAAKELLS